MPFSPPVSSERPALPPVENGIARGLPRDAYTSEHHLEIEYQRIFARHWTFAGFAHEAAAAGDAYPTQVASQPILIARGEDGVLRAFHNVCRHRGHILLRSACRGAKSLVCPYHAWTYGMDGALRRAPHFGGYAKVPRGFVPGDFGLKSIRCQVWQDWVFVNLSGNAPDIDTHVNPMLSYLDGADLSRARVVAKMDLGVVRANWKLLIENFVEPYHVPVVHRDSAAGQPLRDHYMIVDGHCFGCAIDVSGARAGERGRRLDMSTRYLTLFPNFVFAWYQPDQIGVHLNLPLGPDRTHQIRVIYHLGETTPDPEYVSRLSALWKRVHQEDHAVVEELQAGRASSAMDDGGLLSPHWETSVRRFHELLVDALSGNGPEPDPASRRAPGRPCSYLPPVPS